MPGWVGDKLARLAGPTINESQLKELVTSRIAKLESPDDEDRIAAAVELGKIGADAKEALPVLINALKDPIARVRSSVAHALGQIGPDSEEVMSALLTPVRDSDPSVRRNAADAIGGPFRDIAGPVRLPLEED